MGRETLIATTFKPTYWLDIPPRMPFTTRIVAF